jgi:hypothetical protein
MRSGSVYARPTPAPRTAGSASSSSPGLLPAPVASDTANPPGPEKILERSAHSRGVKLSEHLLRTPTATPYGNNQSPSPGAAVRPSLDQLAPMLLPTPRATDGTNGGPNQRGSSGDLMLPSAVMLLPTPQAQNGEERNQTIWARDPSEPQNLENALAFVLLSKPREATDPLSGDGRHGQQLSIEED